MQIAELQQLQEWFGSYVATFGDLDPEGLRNIRLKQDHTQRVVACMEALAAGEGLTDAETTLACAVALLHDVGRFPQYRRWRTFRDSESDNHARLSLEVIRDEALLQRLPAEEQLLIEEAVRLHNLLTLPDRISSPTDRFIRLIRDADKLDIWRVFLDYFQLPEGERASAVGLGFPDLPEVTPACLEALAAGEIVRLEQARVLNDFKLLQISWVYDLNFTTTRRLLLERDYLRRLAATLPASPLIQRAVDRAMSSLLTQSGQP
ncbi:HD domain-containing protein [Trichlorobacter lovleyi]|uniref:Metal-dependent phosphohydrolase HD sub domain n=1 Tax=Trichlorobacter lovleyi (strain ATCC BAA-1151 / DSM 17278 / SZ) TaxID=398767 RepID=B3E946_TRIL1|nr:HD domain-containing protein [Trichlorobacter lovleyi]ACD96759.1 metal-dependent phosphohydrolase HD sub domain [Trichlorobacter lovleyi SZ]QOX80036.1 HD domain-containing protein [Trichlorobacter lovleyi]